MTTLSGPDAVLSRVTSRLRWAGFGRRLSTLILSISAVLGVAVLFVRLTGLVNLPLDEMVTLTAGLIGIQTIGVADWAGLGVLAAILMLAAVATPPDVVSQVVLFTVVYGLYEISIQLVRRIERRREADLRAQGLWVEDDEE